MIGREAGDGHERSHRTDEARRAMGALAGSLSARRTLRGLQPAWSKAATRLTRRDAIAPEALEAAVAKMEDGESFGQLLLRVTEVPEGTIAEALSRATTSPVIQLTTYPVHGEPFRSAEEALAAPRHPVLIDDLAARLLPEALCVKHDMVLVAAWDHEGVIAMVDPADEGALWEAQEATGLRLTRFTALGSQIRLALDRCWQPRADVDVPPSGTARESLPFFTAVGVPAALMVVAFLFMFRDALNLQHHFALAALACGIFFFSYALRYYITTAAVMGTVLFGDRLRRQRILSGIRASKTVDPRKLSLAALAADGQTAPKASHQDYRTLRGERLDEIGAIVSATPETIGEHRLPRWKQPFISIHLAMYNERHVIDRLLRACTSFDYDNYEVIVADDSTDPQALAILDKWSEHPRVRILHRATRKGFKGGALQEALKQMSGQTEYVMIFDADFIPPPDAIWHFLDYFGRLGNDAKAPYTDLRGVAGSAAEGDQLAAVQGYQWHMLNAGESWITKGIRTEFSGSYVLERAAQELFGTMKMISGSVYMIRADVLRRLGWSTSITEDWELTIRLYLAGYKVLYTPYIQAPSECVSKIKQLIRQRMRWARGHTFNVKKYFFAIMRSRQMTWREKLEFLYYAPYYLQSILFLAGTLCWVVGIFLLDQQLPQWGETLGWSLVVSNVLALPLMNLAGLILEGSVKRDLVGLGSFIGLSTLLVPFQGWAALRGLLEPTEGGWDRTPKSGRITESMGTHRLGRIIPWELPKRAKLSSRATHILVTCVAGVLAGAIVGVGALSMRAAASTGNITEGDLVVPFIFGTLIPLAVVGYGWFRLHRRVAVCVLAAAIGLSANVVFLANAVPANATAGLTSTFYFRNSTTFGCADLDMIQSAPTSGTDSTLGTWRNVSRTFCSDTFTSTMSIGTGTVVVTSWWTNTSGGVTCTITFDLQRNSTSLGTTTLVIPKKTNSATSFTSNIGVTGFTFADGDRLNLVATGANTASCDNATLYYDSTTHDSNMVTTTIVPEAILGLLLVAPILPVAIRRGWIPVPGRRVRAK